MFFRLPAIVVFNNNININPTIIDEVSIAYQFKDKSIKLSYNKIKDPVYYATSYNDSQNSLTFQTKNFEKRHSTRTNNGIPHSHKDREKVCGTWIVPNKIKTRIR